MRGGLSLNNENGLGLFTFFILVFFLKNGFLSLELQKF